ncbi:MAG: peptide ABC transporter substrate-binding protein [Planctomycetota bacterium]|nr:MAG: peptide ABC transporter substrate-binding protein [Planctomycetota bacterium]
MLNCRGMLLPGVAGLGALCAVGWALNKGRLEPADFTFVNGTEVKSLDPAIVTGQPENRMINALFEGLVRWHPETLEPIPGVAERWEISADRLTYTFYLRSNARWSDGSPVTAEDFRYSLRRFLDPRTGAEYAYQAWSLRNAKKYSSGGRALRPGDAVEVELNLPEDAVNTRRGEVIRGKLLRIEDGSGNGVPLPSIGTQSADAAADAWTYVVVADGGEHRYRCTDDSTAADRAPPPGVRWCRQVLIDFEQVGVRVIDDHTLVLSLENPTPYFLNLLGFYSLFPVQRACIEKYGSPQWTDVERIVCNGPFRPRFRRLRDRTRVVKNPMYWNASAARLRSVDFLATESSVTGLNLYLTGEVDWIYDVPPAALRELLKQRPPRDDLNPQPILSTYFYLLNVTRKPLDDGRVRRALSLAMDRRELTQGLLGAGERAAYSLTPPGLPGYTSAECPPEDAAEARRLLAEAGFPDGRGFPVLEILYNTHETHAAIAQLVRKQWQRTLGIRVKTRNEEFATQLNSQRALNYDISRRAWIGDYADPNTYLDMFVTGGENNCTGFSSARYDQLIRDAAREPDAERRMAMLHQAEQILMAEMPLIPMYFYVSKSMLKPYVRGFYNNILDHHPLHAIWIDREQATPNPFLRGRR